MGSLIALVALVTPARAGERVPGTEWLRYEAPEAAGWSVPKLKEAAQFSDSLGSAAWMLVQDGAVVAWHGEIERRFLCHSMRKSLLSALLGREMERGKFTLESTLADLGIDDTTPLTDIEKRATVRNLMMTRSGVYLPAAYESEGMARGRPVRGSHEPGTWWYYNNWDFNALGTIYEKTSGKDIFGAFAREIATPLGMQDFRERDGYHHLEPERSRHPAYPFRMSTRDLARFGLMYSREGRWGENQVVPAEWVKSSTKTRPVYPGADQYYGYLWWGPGGTLATHGTYFASGIGGHVIVVIPAQDLVFVHRSNTYVTDGIPEPRVFDLLSRILDARTNEIAAEPKLIPLEASEPTARARVPELEELARFARTYEFPSGRKVSVTIEGRVLRLTNDRFGVFDLEPVSDREFRLEDSRNSVFFLQGANGPRLVESEISRDEAEDLMGAGRARDAAEVLRSLVDCFPKDASALDLLATAYQRADDGQHAEAAARSSLALRPDGIDAQWCLFQLGADGFRRRELDPESLRSLAGDYDFGGGRAAVEFIDGGLMTKRPRASESESLVPISETTFFLAGEPPSRFVFTRAADGGVTLDVLSRGGERGRGTRVDPRSPR